MGGRIGPMLFFQRENTDFIKGRSETTKRRSLPYITTYDFVGVTIRNQSYANPNDDFIPGLPLPTNTTSNPRSFWLTSTDSALGGLIADSDGVQFGVPNMVYDYQTPYRIDGYSSAVSPIHQIFAKNFDSNPSEPIGLFSAYQFKQFRGTALSDTISPTTLDEEIARVRAPTSYEGANYLIPTPNDFNISKGLDSFGFITGQKETLSNGIHRYKARVYAPLYKDAGNNQTDLLYTNKQDVLDAIFNFMRQQKTAMEKYRAAMNKASIAIWNQQNRVAGGAVNSKQGYVKAAQGVSDISTDTNPGGINDTPKTCNSIAGQFLYFYNGKDINTQLAPQDAPGCPQPMSDLLKEYFSKSANDQAYDPTYYAFDLSWPDNESPDKQLSYMSAYTPGPFTGVGEDGRYVSPIPGAGIADNMRRNFYSTKFITLDSLQSGGGPRWDNAFPIMSEGKVGSLSGDAETKQNAFKNPINPAAVDLDINSIKY